MLRHICFTRSPAEGLPQGVPPLLSSYMTPLSFSKLLPARVLGIAAVNQQPPELSAPFRPAQELLRLLPALCSVSRLSIAAHADVFLAAPLALQEASSLQSTELQGGKSFAAEDVGWQATWISTAMGATWSDSDMAASVNGSRESGTAAAAPVDEMTMACPPPQLLLIPAHRCLLAARSSFFQTLMSGRWEGSEHAPQLASSSGSLSVQCPPGPLSGPRSPVVSPQSSVHNPQSPAHPPEPREGCGDMVALPVVRLEQADAEGLLQLLAWLGTGRMQLLPALLAAPAGAGACAGCHPRRTAVLSASLAGTKLTLHPTLRCLGWLTLSLVACAMPVWLFCACDCPYVACDSRCTVQRASCNTSCARSRLLKMTLELVVWS